MASRPDRTRVRRLGALAGGLLLALVTAACGGSSGGAKGAAPKATVVDSTELGALGPVLTTSSGQMLYLFVPDAERHVTCVRACAASWPPLTAAPGTTPEAGAGVQQSLLGTDADPAGGPRVVTYDQWPLYTYQDDVKPRQANGQGLDLNGGYWYVMAPSGQPVTLVPGGS